jgi:hypothetical protein
MFDIHQTKLTTHIYTHNHNNTTMAKLDEVVDKENKEQAYLYKKGSQTTDELRSIQYPDLGTG